MATCDLTAHLNNLKLDENNELKKSFEEIHLIYPICLAYIKQDQVRVLPRYWICNSRNFIDPFCQEVYFLLELPDILKLPRGNTATIIQRYGQKMSFDQVKKFVDDNMDCFVVIQQSQPTSLRHFEGIAIPNIDISS